ncbi:hypothetical protein FBEOM_3289 [Fusarium beomiforme]|uniref:Uncharacterized protein n=1 Tax=Fusarium beomiforme TaxID=44412 RepID=A0A9P5AQB5_9HYPO|nr:hypothetical protein FBEOM_3289 [Fusarium beomiforme]
MNNDIRSRYKLAGPHAAIVAHILESRDQPASKNAALPGFDCLIVVLRRIYSLVMLADGKPLGWLKASEEQNPLLRFAWHLFENGKEEEAFSDRKQILNALQSKGLSGRSSFEALCTSSLMNETFWSQDDFRLTDILYYMDSREEAEGSRDETARDSLLELNIAENPSLTLQEVVDNSFGPKTRGDKQVILDINGLRSLHLPIFGREMDQTHGTFEIIGYNEYFIMAIVRLRHGDSSQEYVRTYKDHGANIIAQREPSSYVDNKWSIKDSGKYMLFYCLKTFNESGDPSCFPEVAEPPISEAEALLLRDIDEHLKGLIARMNMQTSPQTEPQAKSKSKSGKQPSAPAADAAQSSQEGLSKPSPDLATRPPSSPSHPENIPGSSVPQKRTPQVPQDEVFQQQGAGKKRRKPRNRNGPQNREHRQDDPKPGDPQDQSKAKLSQASKADRAEQSRNARRGDD